MRKKTKSYIILFLALFFLQASDDDSIDNNNTTNPKVKGVGKELVYTFDIKDNINPAVWRSTKKSFEEAKKLNADYIIIHMNTYGGLVNIADSIRTIILNSGMPVYVFIDNNAASAGALISIACDSIYMRDGANIGAATVVNQQGEAAPDKYQSYMRSTMRSTAESHGKDTIIDGNDTIIKWFRDPKIAEAMVDERIAIEGITEEGKVLTFTANEAVKNGFCEGIAENIKEVIKQVGIENYDLKKFKPSSLDRIIGFLLNPALRGILIMLIIGGIYYELQSPGIGFPLIAAIIAALVYFAPAYLEGLAENWEILLFVAGIGLLIIEAFVIPGFGVAGISGIILIVTGLAFSMVDNIVFDFNFLDGLNVLGRAFLVVVISFILSLLISIYLSNKILTSPRFSKLVLGDTQEVDKGYISVDASLKTFVGKHGKAYTVLRPSGKIEIEGELYDARSEIGYIEKGEDVRVISASHSQLYVVKA